jgi:hypothetical protein
MDIISRKVNECYLTSLCEIVSVLGGALLKERTSDEQRYIQVTIDSIEQMTLLLRIPHTNLRKNIIQSIIGKLL